MNLVARIGLALARPVRRWRIRRRQRSIAAFRAKYPHALWTDGEIELEMYGNVLEEM